MSSFWKRAAPGKGGVSDWFFLLLWLGGIWILWMD